MSACKKIFTISFLAVLFLGDFLAGVSQAIPVFARRYEISCPVCHVGFPMLNEFGESFAGNGYQFPDEDLKEQTVDTGDDKLLLLKQLPLAIRVDSFFRSRADTGTNSDFEAPFGIKLLSSAPLAKNISYYFYFFFNERGDVSGVEDAFIYFNNGYKDVDLDLRIGQFQVSDILFPREQRLTFQDFTYYVTAVSDSGFKLTYDRIAELSYSFDLTENLGMGLVGAVANGNGIGQADSDRNFDSDNFKNFYGKVAFDYGGQSLGFYGYWGREENAAGFENEFYRIGPDFSLSLPSDWNLWGNFLYGEDSNPRFSSGVVDETSSWGGFVGVTRPFGDGWIWSLLYNRVKVTGRRDLDAHTLTANVSYYFMHNLKVMAEFTGDIEKESQGHPRKEHTGVLGIVLAY
jgi:hypothetical protein